jgi:ParB family chromosome partitioning protein
MIQPLIVHPLNSAGRYVLIVGERRLRAAILAGEKIVPALIRSCDADEVLDIQVAENMGLGLRSALEPREMANAIQAIAERFDSRELAAEHFGESHAWLNQATAVAASNLSPKIVELMDSGKITSAGTAVQLEKLIRKNEARAECLMEEIVNLPAGEKLTKKVVDRALSEAGGRRKKLVENRVETFDMVNTPVSPGDAVDISHNRNQINPNKVMRVASILGLTGSNEVEVLARLIDEFLLLKGGESPPF